MSSSCGRPVGARCIWQSCAYGMIHQRHHTSSTGAGAAKQLGTVWKATSTTAVASIFDGQVGKLVASDMCTVVDDGVVDRHGSVAIDDEGGARKLQRAD